MLEARPAVALLFDDAELGGHLRQVLQEHGARIVHEGTVAGFDAAVLGQFDPDVLVVNLDEEDDAAFDRLVEMIDGERPRLVFNDARASRALSGWDRARWARHLAVKVLASGDVDPPRPADAQVVEAASMAVFAPDEAQPVEPDPAAPSEAASHDLAVPDLPEPAGSPLHDGAHEAQSRAASVDLEAELAALLAAAEPLPDEDAAPSAPRRELPLHDGDFSHAMSLDEELPEVPVEAVAPAAGRRRPPRKAGRWSTTMPPCTPAPRLRPPRTSASRR